MLRLLFRRDLRPTVLAVLGSSSSVRIAVPCSQLSTGSSGTGSRVLVAVKSVLPNGEVVLNCGGYWRGAPSGPCTMHYTTLLAHANDAVLRNLMDRIESRVWNTVRSERASMRGSLWIGWVSHGVVNLFMGFPATGSVTMRRTGLNILSETMLS